MHVGCIQALSRRLDFSGRYLPSLTALALEEGGAAALAVSLTLSALMDGALPGPADREVKRPPAVSRPWWVRRVGFYDVWIYFTFGADSVLVIQVMGLPPARDRG